MVPGADPPPEVLSLIHQLLEKTPDVPLEPGRDSTWREADGSSVSLTDLYGSKE